ncbi:glycosyltransferase [Halomonas sp. AOP31-B1-25]|uniref:glycosyltransferase n=1 Tax=Halomonas sp. AOP31-B1-25 TaxID=3457694 RepID=UPI00403326F3
MRKHNFIMIRYSVLSKSKSWRLNQNFDFDDYKDKLFDKRRLEIRESLFKKITLPSVVNLDPEMTTVLVFVSEEMPKEYYERLESIVKYYSHIKLVKLNYFDKITPQMNGFVRQCLIEMGGSFIYSTVRLDDDDAISKKFPSLINNYLDIRFAGYCISFSSGVGAVMKNGEVDELYLRCVPKIAIGIAWINFFDEKNKEFKFKEVSVYNLGNHMKVDLNFPTVIDPREHAWLRTLHDESDIYNVKLVERYREANVFDIEESKKYFFI